MRKKAYFTITKQTPSLGVLRKGRSQDGAKRIHPQSPPSASAHAERMKTSERPGTKLEQRHCIPMVAVYIAEKKAHGDW